MEMAASRGLHGDVSVGRPTMSKPPPICVVCGKTFPNDSALQEHTIIHKKETPFECSYCDMRYKDFIALGNHLRQLHSRRPFRLKVGEVVNSNSDWTGQLDGVRYQCAFCWDILLEQRQFLEHMKRHSIKCFKCEHCPMRFAFDGLRRQHSNRVHIRDPTELEVKPKGNAKNVPDGEWDPILNSAVIRVNGEGSVFIVEDKEDECVNRVEFPPPIIKDKIPSVKVKTPRVKVKTVAAKPNTTVSCPVCQQTFKQKCSLEEHMLRHSGEKPMECLVCHKRFRYRTGVKRHVKLMHKAYPRNAYRKVGDSSQEKDEESVEALLALSDSGQEKTSGNESCSAVKTERFASKPGGGDGVFAESSNLWATPIVGNGGLVNPAVQPVAGSGGFVGSGIGSVVGTGGLMNPDLGFVSGSGGFVNMGIGSGVGNSGYISGGGRPVYGNGGFVDSVAMSVYGSGGSVTPGYGSSAGNGAFLDRGVTSVAGSGGFVDRGVTPVAGSGGFVDRGVTSVAGNIGFMSRGVPSVQGSGGFVDRGVTSVPGSGGFMDRGVTSVAESAGFVDREVASVTGSGGFVARGDTSVAGSGGFVSRGDTSIAGSGGFVSRGVTSVAGSGGSANPDFRPVTGSGGFTDKSARSLTEMGKFENPNFGYMAENGGFVDRPVPSKAARTDNVKVPGSDRLVDGDGRDTGQEDGGECMGYEDNTNTSLSMSTCVICNQQFANKTLLQEHLLTHTFENLYACVLCKMRFAHPDTLDQHVKKEHGGLEDSKGLGTASNSSQAKHIKYRYTYTEGVFMRNVNPVKPKPPTIPKKSRDGKVLRFQCTLCLKLCPNRKAFELHLMKIHGGCPVHKWVLKFLDQSKESPMGKDGNSGASEIGSQCSCKGRTTSGEARLYSCNTCSKVFRTKTQLRHHMDRHNVVGDKSFKCDLCGMGFWKKNYYIRHKSSIHITCPVHKKTWAPHAPTLNRLMRETGNMLPFFKPDQTPSETGSLPETGVTNATPDNEAEGKDSTCLCPERATFKCASFNCGMTFSTALELHRHTLIHTRRKGPKNSTVNLRSEQRSSGKLQRIPIINLTSQHLTHGKVPKVAIPKLKSKQQPNSYIKRSVKCDYCELKFSTLSHCRRHARAMHKDCPSPQGSGGKAVERRGDVQAGASFVCILCDRTFDTLISVCRHMRNVHRGCSINMVSGEIKLSNRARDRLEWEGKIVIPQQVSHASKQGGVERMGEGNVEEMPVVGDIDGVNEMVVGVSDGALSMGESSHVASAIADTADTSHQALDGSKSDSTNSQSGGKAQEERSHGMETGERSESEQHSEGRGQSTNSDDANTHLDADSVSQKGPVAQTTETKEHNQENVAGPGTEKDSALEVIDGQKQKGDKPEGSEKMDVKLEVDEVPEDEDEDMEEGGLSDKDDDDDDNDGEAGDPSLEEKDNVTKLFQCTVCNDIVSTQKMLDDHMKSHADGELCEKEVNDSLGSKGEEERVEQSHIENIVLDNEVVGMRMSFDFLPKIKLEGGDSDNDQMDGTEDIQVMEQEEGESSELPAPDGEASPCLQGEGEKPTTSPGKTQQPNCYKVFRCNFCGQIFSYKNALLKHLLLAHKGRCAVAVNNLCNSDLSDSKKHDGVIWTEHVIVIPPKAASSQSGDVQVDQPKNIMAQKAATQGKDLIANENEEADHSYSSVQGEDSEGTRQPTPEEGRVLSYQCTICMKLFLSESFLLSHELTHKALGTYMCEFCDEKFPFLWDYKKHLSKMHEGEVVGDQWGIDAMEEDVDKEMTTTTNDGESPKDQQDGSRLESMARKPGKRGRGSDPPFRTYRTKTFPCSYCSFSSGNFNAYWEHVKIMHKQHSYILPSKNSGQSIEATNKQQQGEDNNKPGDGQSSLQCPVCNLTFRAKSVLRYHMNSHTGLKPYACHFCAATFGHISTCYRHMRMVHKDEKPVEEGGVERKEHQSDRAAPSIPQWKLQRNKDYTCDYCGQVLFCTKRVYEEHVRKHTGERPYKCGVCKKRFNYLRCMKRHVINVHKMSWYDYKVNVLGGETETGKNSECDDSDTWTREDQDTNKSPPSDGGEEDGDGTQQHQCTVCLKTFGAKRYLQQHMKVHTERKMFYCRLCNDRFNWWKSAFRHVKVVHKKKDKEEASKQIGIGSVGACDEHTPYKCLVDGGVAADGPIPYKEARAPYKCDYCEQLFTSKYLRQKHLQAAHKDRIVPKTPKRTSALCSICGKVCAPPYKLKRHMMAHSDTRPYKCELCHWRFKTPRHLSDHRRRQHQEALLKCDFCHQKFKYESTIRKHQRHHEAHGVCPQQSAVKGGKGFECSLCGVAISSMPYLRRHIQLVHSTDTPYQCQYCSFKYTWRSTYVRHLRSVHKGLPWPGRNPKISKSKKQEGVSDPSQTEVSTAAQSIQSSQEFIDQPTNSVTTHKVPDVRRGPQDFLLGESEDYGGVSEGPEFWMENNPQGSYGGQSVPVPMSAPLPAALRFPTSQESREDDKFLYLPVNEKQLLDPDRVKYTALDYSAINSSNAATGIGTGKQTSGYLPVSHDKAANPDTSGEGTTLEGKDPIIQCTECGKMIRKGSLPQHMLRHTGERPRKCHLCDNAYRQRNALLRHLKKAHGLVKKPAVLFGDKNAGQNVMEELPAGRKKKGRLVQVFQCIYCERKIYSKAKFLNHVRKHTGEVPYQCDFCHKRFRTLSHIQTHLRTLNGKCGAGRTQTATGEGEGRAVGDVSVRQLRCRLCGEALHQKADYWEHVRLHAGEKPFQCDHCGLTFVTPEDLQQHTVAFHKDTIQTGKAGAGAGTGTVAAGNTNTNTNSQTSSIASALDDSGQTMEGDGANIGGDVLRMVEVEIVQTSRTPVSRVGRVTGRSGEDALKMVDLDSLPATTSDQRQKSEAYTCQHCGKNFFCPKRVFDEHVRKHTGERPHKCPVCGKGFNYLRCQRRHLLKLHNIDYKILKPGKGSGDNSANDGHASTNEATTQEAKSAEIFNIADAGDDSGDSNRVTNIAASMAGDSVQIQTTNSTSLAGDSYSQVTSLAASVVGDDNQITKATTTTPSLDSAGHSLDSSAVGVGGNAVLKMKVTEVVANKPRQRSRARTCEHCGQEFYCTARIFEEHVRKHTGERPNKCHVCGNDFNYQYNLRRHLLQVHNIDYKLLKSNQQVNAATTNDDKALTYEEKKEDGVVFFQCTTCGQTFLERAKVEDHIRSHTGDRPFKCGLCDKQFRYKCGARTHMINVHGAQSVVLMADPPESTSQDS